MNSKRYSQQGGSTIGTLLVLLSAALLLVFAVKIIPIYLDDLTVQGILENLQEEENIGELSVRQLKERIQRGISVNNVDVIGPKDIQLARDGNQISLSLVYDVRTPLFQNIDAVVHFDHHYEWTSQ